MVTASELLAAAKDTELNDINAQGPDGLTLLARVAHFLHHTTADEDLATIKATLRLVLQKGGKIFSPTDPVSQSNAPEDDGWMLVQVSGNGLLASPTRVPRSGTAAVRAGTPATSKPLPVKSPVQEHKATHASHPEAGAAHAAKPVTALATKTSHLKPETSTARRTNEVDKAAPASSHSLTAPLSPQPYSPPKSPSGSDAAWVEPDERASLFRTGNVRLQVLSCSLVAGKGTDKEHARFVISVSDASTGVCWWKTTRRFSDFEHLAKEVDDAELTGCLPKKGWGMGTSKLKKAESRVPQLNEFLVVLQQPRLLHHSAVLRFFDVPLDESFVK